MAVLSWASAVAGAALPQDLMEPAGLPGRLITRADDRTMLTDLDTGRSFVPGERSTDRTIYNTIALFCTIVLSVFLGMSAGTAAHSLTTADSLT